MTELECLQSITALLSFIVVVLILYIAWWLFMKFSGFLNSFF